MATATIETKAKIKYEIFLFLIRTPYNNHCLQDRQIFYHRLVNLQL